MLGAGQARSFQPGKMPGPLLRMGGERAGMFMIHLKCTVVLCDMMVRTPYCSYLPHTLGLVLLINRDKWET